MHSGECNSIFLLHSWEIELSIRHHVTKINQLHDLNLTRYYINVYMYIDISKLKDRQASLAPLTEYFCALFPFSNNLMDSHIMSLEKLHL